MGADDKKKRGQGDVPRLVQFLLLAVPIAYLVVGYGFPLSGSMGSVRGTHEGDGAKPKSGFARREIAAAGPVVPVPKVPRSIIKFYDGNTVVT